MNNGNYCECCEGFGDVQLYIDSDDNAVDLCESCHKMLSTPDNTDSPVSP